MRKWIVGLVGLSLATGTGVAVAGTAAAAPVRDRTTGAAAAAARGAGGAADAGAAGVDDQPGPLEQKRRAERTAAVSRVLDGRAVPQQRDGSTVVDLGPAPVANTGGISAKKTGPDKYVELKREKTDKIFVILVEFGNQRDPAYPDRDTDPITPGPVKFDGPLHNQLPKPDRTRDNATIWQPDFNRQHFQDLYFGKSPKESLKTYYEQESSGRYSVDGTVSDWVKVPYNEARYGRSNGYPCAYTICNNTWNLIQDALTAWVTSQHAKGRTDAQIKADLKAYDQWDRYDYNHNGNFNEPDGYVDHFQIVHAGGDQADGDKVYGEDAIWSHRSYNFPGTSTGPSFNKLGGSQIGNTGLWVGDYTIQPENGGLGVFAHEYGHDLGLPDEYDTSGASGFAENGVNWWTIMGQDRVGGLNDPVGAKAPDFGAWDKLQLGWLDYEVVKAGRTKTLELGPHEYNSPKAQGLVVVLPKKSVTTQLPAPVEGTKDWYSGSGDQLNNTLTRQLTLPAQPATLTFQTSYDIEDCGTDQCDYAYVEVDDGSGYKAIAGNITVASQGNGIKGTSKGWVPASFDLSAYAGKTVGLRLRYATDPATEGLGFFVDDLKVTAGGATVFADGAENGSNGWTATGFTAVGSSVTTAYDNYYVASNRTYEKYDRYMKTGPYSYGFGPVKPNWVEHFPYETGLLISYWDTSYRDNNTSQHPGGGEILPVDAHPDLFYRLDGTPWKPHFQGYDDPFSLAKADSLTLHYNGTPSYIRGQAAQPLFDDSRSYYREDPDVGMRYGVKLPKNGVKIRVLKQSGTSMTVNVS